MSTDHDFYKNMEVRDNLRTDRGFQMTNGQILHLFGLPPSGPIPPDYSAEKVIGNIKVSIHPRGKLPIRRRVVAECPTCSRLVCAGHLDQHMKVHNGKPKLF